MVYTISWRKYQGAELPNPTECEDDTGRDLPVHNPETSKSLENVASANIGLEPLKRSLPNSFTSRSICSDARPAKIPKQDGILNDAGATSQISRLSILAVDGSLLEGIPDQTLDYEQGHAAPSEDFWQWAKDSGSLSLKTVWHYFSVIKTGSQALSTFSRSDVLKMKRAADFLRSTNRPREAFSLYATVLRYWKTLANLPQYMLTWLVMACATTASVSPQFEISRALLEKRLEELDGTMTQAEAFVLYRLLASIHHLMGDLEQHRRTMQAANTILFHDDVSVRTMLARLPTNHPSVDLYFCYLTVNDYDSNNGQVVFDRIRYDPSLPVPIPVSLEEKSVVRMKTMLSPHLLFIPVSERCFNHAPVQVVKKELIHRDPGPFNILGDISSRNSCVRSCIEWCRTYLDMLKECPHMGSCIDQDAQLLTVFATLWFEWQDIEEPPLHPLNLHG